MCSACWARPGQLHGNDDAGIQCQWYNSVGNIAHQVPDDTSNVFEAMRKPTTVLVLHIVVQPGHLAGSRCNVDMDVVWRELCHKTPVESITMHGFNVAAPQQVKSVFMPHVTRPVTCQTTKTARPFTSWCNLGGMVIMLLAA